MKPIAKEKNADLIEHCLIDRCISEYFLNDFYLITVEKKQNLKISESY